MIIDTVNKYLFNSLIHVTRWLTENETRNLLGRPASRFLGGATLLIKQGSKKETIEQIAEEWQRMFPSKEMVPIVKVEGDTVFAEVKYHCPYRGTGNVEGCYRMMEYDRKMLETIGAELVVLRSQAEPGVERCRLAITRELQDRKDLIPAHLKT
jgi:hypothetical protein